MKFLTDDTQLSKWQTSKIKHAHINHRRDFRQAIPTTTLFPMRPMRVLSDVVITATATNTA